MSSCPQITGVFQSFENCDFRLPFTETKLPKLPQNPRELFGGPVDICNALNVFVMNITLSVPFVSKFLKLLNCAVIPLKLVLVLKEMKNPQDIPSVASKIAELASEAEECILELTLSKYLNIFIDINNFVIYVMTIQKLIISCLLDMLQNVKDIVDRGIIELGVNVDISDRYIGTRLEDGKIEDLWGDQGLVDLDISTREEAIRCSVKYAFSLAQSQARIINEGSGAILGPINDMITLINGFLGKDEQINTISIPDVNIDDLSDELPLDEISKELERMIEATRLVLSPLEQTLAGMRCLPRV